MSRLPKMGTEREEKKKKKKREKERKTFAVVHIRHPRAEKRKGKKEGGFWTVSGHDKNIYIYISSRRIRRE